VRVAALADLHGRLDGVVVPPCDLVVIAGDLAPYAWKQAPSQVPWLNGVFAPWLEGVAAAAGAPVVGIAGNRDFAWWWDRRVFERLPWTFLNDSEVTLAGARIYGSPWCPRRRVRPKADEPQPPSPPLGHGDLTSTGEHVGASALTAAIARTQPALAVFGHIHEGRGVPTREGRTLCANSAICDRFFVRANQPWLVDIDLVTGVAELVAGVEM
jgi:hypothetical protein